MTLEKLDALHNQRNKYCLLHAKCYREGIFEPLEVLAIGADCAELAGEFPLGVPAVDVDVPAGLVAFVVTI